MRAIAELSSVTGIAHDTLLKAAQQGRIPARQSGKTWLVDDESEAFKSWLTGSQAGRPRTIRAETPEYPEWVSTSAGKQAWRESLEWRCDAVRAETEQYRHFLLREAERVYGDRE